MAKKKKPIYEYIAENVKDGKLPEDFTLIKSKHPGMPSMDGAIDGIKIFHMGDYEYKDEDTIMMKEATLAAHEGNFVRAEKLFYKLGEEIGALDAIEVIQDVLPDLSEKLNMQNVYDTFQYLLYKSPNPECVKIGIILLGMNNLPLNRIKYDIRMLGLCEEFTLYSIYCMLQWDNGNDEIFELAGKVQGWGKIFATMYLEPKTTEIKKWMLHEGIYNTVDPQYSAFLCMDKLRPYLLSRKKLNREELTSFGNILTALLEEGPVTGIRGLDNAEEILELYLEQAGMKDLNIDDYTLINEIYMYAKNVMKNKEITNRAEKLIFNVECIAVVKESMKKEGEGIFIAQVLDLPYEEEILHLMDERFDEKFFLSAALLEGADRLDEILEIYRKHLPTESIPISKKITGSEEDILLTVQLTVLLNLLRVEELKGSDYVERILKTKSPELRALAVDVVKGWVGMTGEPLRKLSPSLYMAVRNASDKETNRNLKMDIELLLSGEIFFEDDLFDDDPFM